MGLFDGPVVVSVASPNPAGTYTPRADFTSECTRRHVVHFRRQYVNLRFPGPSRWSVPKGTSSDYIISKTCEVRSLEARARARRSQKFYLKLSDYKREHIYDEIYTTKVGGNVSCAVIATFWAGDPQRW